MDELNNATPESNAAPAPAAPVAPAAPDLSGLDTPAPSLPNLSSPAAQPSLQGTQEYQGYKSAVDAESAAAKEQARIANTPVIDKNMPHARLFGIISAIGTGLSAFGTAVATGGKEGGAKEVAEIQGEQQRQKLQAQEAAQAQKNSQIQQQVIIGQTNHALAQNYLNLMTMPDEIAAHHLQVAQGQQNYEAGKTAAAQTQAEFLTNFGMTPQAFTSMMNGDTSASDPKDIQNLKSFTTQKVNAASQILGADDATVKQAQQILADPKSTPQDIFSATTSVNRAVGLKGQVTAAQNQQLAGLPKNQQEAASQLAAAKQSGDPARIAKAQATSDAIDTAVQGERKFAADLQEANAKANKDLQFSNTLAQKGIEDTNKLWTDPTHGFGQTAAQVNATKDIVAQAKNGSELAASLEPAMTVLGVNSFAGVHRISPTEYEAASSGVGSLYRRLNQALDKAGKGAVTPATLSEVNGIMDALLNQKYQSSVNSTRQIAANTGIPENRISVPDPNNFSTFTTLDKVPAAARATTQGTRAVPGSPASKVHANMTDFKQITPTKEHGNLYTDDGKTWYTSDGTVYGGK